MTMITLQRSFLRTRKGQVGRFTVASSLSGCMLVLSQLLACGTGTVKTSNHRHIASVLAPGSDVISAGSGHATADPSSAGHKDVAPQVAAAIPDTTSTVKAAPNCGPSTDPGHVSAHLLSTEEYDNTASDLLFTATKGSTLAIFEAAPKGPTGFATDTGNFALTSLGVSKYWDAASGLADEVIKSKGVAGGAYARIASCAVGQTVVAPTCYTAVIKSLGLRAWRRPVAEVGNASELARLQAIMTAGSSFEEGLKSLIQALMISPNFLFVSITTEQTPIKDASFALSPYQLAVRLSYYLWGTMPDQELFDLASSGKLTEDATLTFQVERLLRSPRAQHVIQAILNDWVGADTLANMVTPTLSDALKGAMLQETKLLIQDLVAADKSLIGLTAAKYSFMNKLLADHYGLPFSGTDPTQFAAVDLSQSPRRGVLSHAAFLLSTAGSTTETRPVKRGKELANNWTCSDIPLPPPGIPAIDPGALPPHATPRQVLAIHTASPSCAGCHNVLDPFGLSFESFDSFGKWRTTYGALGQAPIDSSGVLSNGYKFANTGDMLTYLATDSSVKSCMARKMLELALARPAVSQDDRCVTQTIGQTTLASDSKFSDLVKGIVLSRSFVMQSWESP